LDGRWSDGLKGCVEREPEAEHIIEDTPFIEIEKLVTTADQVLIDENYRDGLPPAAEPHFCCNERVIGDIILCKSHSLDAQEILASPAVNTVLPGIDFYFDFHCNRSGIGVH